MVERGRCSSRAWSVVGMVVLSACGDDNDPAGPDVGPPADAQACLPASGGAGWSFTVLGDGTKPALALAPDGTAHAAFMSEAQPGWVRYASLSPGGAAPSAPETVATGYFYGPIDLLLDPTGAPAVLYHDHDRTDQVLGMRDGGGWTLSRMVSSGHDGWYNRGVFGPDGVLHTATYDPVGFNGRGVIHGAWDGAAWTTEVAVAGDFDYPGGMAIEAAADGTLHVAFFDDVAGEGRLATRAPGGAWSVVTPESRGGMVEAGRFPDLALDADGSTLHLVYLARSGTGSGTVRYGRGGPSGFELLDVVGVGDFTIGFSGARDLATVALDREGRAVVAVQTSAETLVFRVDDGAIEELGRFQARPGSPLGQQTEVAVDGVGRIHLVWWQAGGTPGTVCHAVRG